MKNDSELRRQPILSIFYEIIPIKVIYFIITNTVG